MKPPIEVSAQFMGMSSKADRSFSLRFNTAEEVSPKDAAIYTEYLMVQGWLLFSPNEINYDDVPKTDTPIEGKSLSTRLRDVLYVLYCHKEKGTDFESFYRAQMERLIEHFKGKLE